MPALPALAQSRRRLLHAIVIWLTVMVLLQIQLISPWGYCFTSDGVGLEDDAIIRPQSCYVVLKAHPIFLGGKGGEFIGRWDYWTGLLTFEPKSTKTPLLQP